MVYTKKEKFREQKLTNASPFSSVHVRKQKFPSAEESLMFCSETIMVLMLVSLALNRCKNVVVLVIHTFMNLFAYLVMFCNTELHQQTLWLVFIEIIFSALLPLFVLDSV